MKHNFWWRELKIWLHHKSFFIATSGRPGPVVVDIPKDITAASTDILPDEISIRSYKPMTKGHTGQIKKAAD